ncbi:LysR substrate-binding domain-containing protein [Cupriavidus basilensis]|uniref:LysR substrate-binding domain-containing protein n=1 Tax=Cupriavidus basilensis TaxID=68895 RepID=A0ABT6APZ1_9BURK|nr:LysR family transcriptional regulator [Cupriavidus basilensis]MDF3834694.1 LysR substrate-binding domain-containing protein [Cupriavidus basilensis]
MHIRWLEDFVCLAQAGSLARAAELRNVTPPAFGRRMQALEVWAGAPLIDRSVFPVRLTREGKQFLEAAQSALRTLDEARLSLRAAHRADASTVVIATGKTLARSMVPAWLANLRQQLRNDPVAAGFRTRLSTFPTHDAMVMFTEGDADFLLCYNAPEQPVTLDDARYRVHLVGEERLVCVSAATDGGGPLYKLQARGRAPVPMIAYAETLTLGRMVNQEIARRRLASRLDVIAISDLAESVHEMVRQRMGIAWLPARLIADDLHAGRLVRVGLEAGGETDLAMQILLYRPRAPMRPLDEAFWRAAVA